ncbi:D-alanine--D-alanine ligase family protein [Vulgatibacter incomptus]|nr:hypothetical protein [Vulgatibacter incomptus]
MKITVLYNRDYESDGSQASDPGHEARAEIEGVAQAVESALRRIPGVETRLLPCRGTSLRFAEDLRADPPDLVFNLCESLAGDSRGELAVPAILESLGIPYTGSSSVALALALHKQKAKELLRGVGVPVPDGRVVRRPPDLDGWDAAFPLMVKPAREDASVGISPASVVHDREALERRVRHVLDTHRQEAIVERYVEGRELYVALLGNDPPEVLPITEIDFSELPATLPRIVTYDAKWVPGSVEDRGTRPHLAEITDPEVRARVEHVARETFRTLELRDYGRVDLRLDADGTPWVIDVNANCALAPDAGYARAAAAIGLPYDAMIARLVEVAIERLHADPSWKAERPAPARRPPSQHRELHGGGGELRNRAHRARRGRS